MVVADVRHDIQYLFAAELQDEAQDAVSAGMLRPKIEEHKIGILAAAFESPIFRAKLQRRLLSVFLLFGQTELPHLGGARRMFFAQGVALPGRRHQDAPQMRMAVEGDAEHVPRLALVPVGRGPDVGYGFEPWALAR